MEIDNFRKLEVQNKLYYLTFFVTGILCSYVIFLRFCVALGKNFNFKQDEEDKNKFIELTKKSYKKVEFFEKYNLNFINCIFWYLKEKWSTFYNIYFYVNKIYILGFCALFLTTFVYSLFSKIWLNLLDFFELFIPYLFSLLIISMYWLFNNSFLKYYLFTKKDRKFKILFFLFTIAILEVFIINYFNFFNTLEIINNIWTDNSFQLWILYLINITILLFLIIFWIFWIIFILKPWIILGKSKLLDNKIKILIGLLQVLAGFLKWGLLWISIVLWVWWIWWVLAIWYFFWNIETLLIWIFALIWVILWYLMISITWTILFLLSFIIIVLNFFILIFIKYIFDYVQENNFFVSDSPLSTKDQLKNIRIDYNFKSVLDSFLKNINFLKEKILYFQPSILKSWSYVFSVNAVWWSWKTSFIKIVENEVVENFKEIKKILIVQKVINFFNWLELILKKIRDYDKKNLNFDKTNLFLNKSNLRIVKSEWKKVKYFLVKKQFHIPFKKILFYEIRIDYLKYLYQSLFPPKNKDIIWINYNPWNFENSQNLLKDFFSTLNHEIDKRTWNSYKTIFQKYSNFFNLPKTNNKLINLELLKQKLIEEKPLWEIKTQIEKILWRINETIVITLDDIDRMEPEEIMIILKLVKLLSDFPKIIFILLLDEKRVSNIITTKYWESYNNYLQKIINFQIKLEPYTKEELKAILYFNIRKFFKIKSLDSKIVDNSQQSNKTPEEVIKTFVDNIFNVYYYMVVDKILIKYKKDNMKEFTDIISEERYKKISKNIRLDKILDSFYEKVSKKEVWETSIVITPRDIKELSNNIVEKLYSFSKDSNYKFEDLLNKPIEEKDEIYKIILETFKSQIFIFEKEVLFEIFIQELNSKYVF